MVAMVVFHVAVEVVLVVPRAVSDSQRAAEDVPRSTPTDLPSRV